MPVIRGEGGEEVLGVAPHPPSGFSGPGSFGGQVMDLCTLDAATQTLYIDSLLAISLPPTTFH